MKSGLLKGAIFLRRNLIALAVSFVFFNYFVWMFPFINNEIFHSLDSAGFSLYPFFIYGMPLTVYAAFVIQSYLSPEFRENNEKKEIINDIKRESDECHLAVRNLKRKLEINAQQRLGNVLSESDEIVRSFLDGDKNFLKVRAVQQSLKLTSAYIKLADMFRVRASASSGERISQLAKRINANTANLNSAKDEGVANELRRVIEADERMIDSLKNERFELERIDARLQYMESSISMLKYNIISNLESEDILANLESDVSEADALNSVLNDRYDERRESHRLRL